MRTRANSALLPGEELRQRVGCSFDIGGGEYTRHHRDAVGTGIDHLMRIVDRDAADGKHRYFDMLFDLSENPQGDIGALGFGRGGKWCPERYIVSALLLGGHGACDISVTRGT